MAGNTVLIRSTRKDKEGNLVECSLSSNCVPGGRLVWNKANNFTCEVPIRLEYTNLMTNREEVWSKNWAQELLDNYGTGSHLKFPAGSPQAKRAEANGFGLELVKPDAPKPDATTPEVKRGPGRPSKSEKEKKDEEAAA